MCLFWLFDSAPLTLCCSILLVSNVDVTTRLRSSLCDVADPRLFLSAGATSGRIPNGEAKPIFTREKCLRALHEVSGR